MHISKTGSPFTMNERFTSAVIGFRQRKNMKMKFAVIPLCENI
jgi:hypothetical protein